MSNLITQFNQRRYIDCLLENEAGRDQIKLGLNKSIIKGKRIIKDIIIQRNITTKSRKDLIKAIEIEKNKRFKNQYKIKELELLDQQAILKLKEYKNILSEMGETMYKLINTYERVATSNDLAQLLNANIKQIEEYKKEASIPSFIDLIFVYDIEYRATKQSNKGFYSIEEDYNMPIRTAIKEYVFKELKDNNLLAQAFDEIFLAFEDLCNSQPKDKNHKLEIIKGGIN